MNDWWNFSFTKVNTPQTTGKWHFPGVLKKSTQDGSSGDILPKSPLIRLDIRYPPAPKIR